MHFLQIACGNDDKYRSECWNSWRRMWRTRTICCLSRFDPFFKIYGLDVVYDVFLSFSWRYPIFTISYNLYRYHSLPLKIPYVHCFENFLTVWLLHFWFPFHVLGCLFVIVTPCSLINDYRHFSRTFFLNSHVIRLKIEAAGSSETVIIANEATRYRNPVDYRVNLRSLEQWFRVLFFLPRHTWKVSSHARTFMGIPN